MSRNEITVTASPEAVFELLDDATAYPRWVVGTRRLRRVDPDWPREGSEFHHAIGVPGAELHDSTEVVERASPHRIVLEVRFRPTGTARVELVVDGTDGGSTVTMEETPDSGPISWLPRFVTDPLLHVRNAWSLQRLRHEIERRGRPES
ncbi:MAG TPA: SRPBCC family protein [Acidimicrobiia bacterium]|nr:SRPBCC family protein [Acidimicrobiia bacterium]